MKEAFAKLLLPVFFRYLLEKLKVLIRRFQAAPTTLYCTVLVPGITPALEIIGNILRALWPIAKNQIAAEVLFRTAIF